jgi:hypothetical protein
MVSATDSHGRYLGFLDRKLLLQNNNLQSHRIELHGVICHFTLKVLICKSRLLDLDPWADTSFLIFPFM